MHMLLLVCVLAIMRRALACTFAYAYTYMYTCNHMQSPLMYCVPDYGSWNEVALVSCGHSARLLRNKYTTMH